MLLEDDVIQMIGMSVFAQSMRDDLAARMSQRTTLIGVGLQTTDYQVNQLMKRRFRDEKMIAGVQMMKKYRLNFVLQLIIGLPGDTLASIANSIKYTLSLEPPTIDVFRLMVLPGTEYRRRAEEFELVYSHRPNHYIVSNQSMTPEEINRAERMGQALNVFYNMPNTRHEMYRQVAENHESIIHFCDAIGTFIENFQLLDREELRRGDIIRSVDQAYLMRILWDFERFRGELVRKVASGIESLQETAWADVA